MKTSKIASIRKKITDEQRREAELFYTSAVLHAKGGFKHIAEGYARECIRLLKYLGTETIEQCATSFTCVEGVCLPEFLHEDVVRANLKNCGIDLNP